MADFAIRCISGFYKKTYVECKIIQTSLGNYIFQTITSIFCHNISINKCLANSFTQHDTHFSTPLYFVMAEYIAKGDHHFHGLVGGNMSSCAQLQSAPSDSAKAC